MSEIGRRRKLVRIAPELLYALLTSGPVMHVQCTEGLPEGATYIGMSYDIQRDCYSLCFESDVWEPVPFGWELPTQNVQYRRWELRPLFDQAAVWVSEMPQTVERDRWLKTWCVMRGQMKVPVE